jgi:hypothetical protein
MTTWHASSRRPPSASCLRRPAGPSSDRQPQPPPGAPRSAGKRHAPGDRSSLPFGRGDLHDESDRCPAYGPQERRHVGAAGDPTRHGRSRPSARRDSHSACRPRARSPPATGEVPDDLRAEALIAAQEIRDLQHATGPVPSRRSPVPTATARCKRSSMADPCATAVVPDTRSPSRRSPRARPRLGSGRSMRPTARRRSGRCWSVEWRTSGGGPAAAAGRELRGGGGTAPAADRASHRLRQTGRRPRGVISQDQLIASRCRSRPATRPLNVEGDDTIATCIDAGRANVSDPCLRPLCANAAPLLSHATGANDQASNLEFY